MTQITKHQETKTYSHKGISVCVEINYDKGTISLLESTTKQPKKWLFTGREVEYMPGWLNILEAMKLAIEQAESDLLKHQVLKKKELQKKEISLHKAIADMKPEDQVLKRGFKGNFEIVDFKSGARVIKHKR